VGGRNISTDTTEQNIEKDNEEMRRYKKGERSEEGGGGLGFEMVSTQRNTVTSIVQTTQDHKCCLISVYISYKNIVKGKQTDRSAALLESGFVAITIIS